MKLYATTFVDDAAVDDDGASVRWYGTQADQKTDARKLHSDGMRNIQPKAVHVPTAKGGLLDFLNTHKVQP